MSRYWRRERRSAICPRRAAIGRAHDIDRLQATGISYASPDYRGIRWIDRHIQHLIVSANSKIQRYPAQTGIGTLPDAVLSAKVAGAVGSELDIEDTDAVQSWYVRPVVTSVARTVKRTSKAPPWRETGERDVGI